MEQEILFTGIGGQGIQLAARTLAEAALVDGRRVQLFASYGGMMRGGNSDSFLVISNDEISAPPVVGTAWAAVVMHHEHADTIWPKLRPDGVAVINTSVVDPTCRPDAGPEVLDVAALDIAAELGTPVAASMVLIGALVARTKLVSVDALLDSSARVLPSYRADAAAGNRKALEAGLAVGAPMSEADTTGIKVRGTVVIDVEACKGCDLCIDACNPDVLAMTTDKTNTRGYRFPELLVGCTGCRACADVCPDFCFQVFRYNEPKTWTPEGGLQ